MEYNPIQQRKYNGKEWIEAHGLDEYDYGARGYYPAIGRFTTVDPLAEIKPWITPYHYCSNNPVNRIDPNGMYDLPELTVTAPKKQNNFSTLNILPLLETFTNNSNTNNINNKILPSNFNFSTPKVMNQSTPNNKPKDENAQILEYISAAIGVAGVAADNVSLYTTTYGGKVIVYVTIHGTDAAVQTTKVLTALKGITNATVVAGLAADVVSSTIGVQSWSKTIVNTGVTAVAIIVGGTISATAGAAIGGGYFILDQLGAFDRPEYIPSYNKSVTPQDNTAVVKPIVVPQVFKPLPKSNITTIYSK